MQADFPSDEEGESLFSDEPLDLTPPIVRGRPKATAPAILEVRAATRDDLPLLESQVPTPASFVAIRHPHHQLAQILARGVSNNEASLITGYSPSYISNLRNDPGFADLLSHYGKIEEIEGIDTLKRMRTVGLLALEIMQERITTDPDELSMRELMEIEKLNLLEPLKVVAASSQGATGGGGVKVQVSFVAPSLPQPTIIENES